MIRKAPLLPAASAVAAIALPFLAGAFPARGLTVRFNPTPGLFENVILSPTLVAESTTVRGISGGPLLASEISGRADTVTGPCLGYVDTEPDHRMTLTDFFDFLSLQIQSPEDTTLVVRGPGGSWCSDDVFGFNPAIAGQWFSGTYDIWIGSYTPNTYHPYVIRISETNPYAAETAENEVIDITSP